MIDTDTVAATLTARLDELTHRAEDIEDDLELDVVRPIAPE